MITLHSQIHLLLIYYITYYVCSNMKSYYFSAYSEYNRLNGRRNETANAKKFTLMYLKVTVYNTL